VDNYHVLKGSPSRALKRDKTITKREFAMAIPVIESPKARALRKIHHHHFRN